MADRQNDFLLFEMIFPKLNFLKLHERKTRTDDLQEQLADVFC